MATLGTDPRRHREFRKNFYNPTYLLDQRNKFTFVEAPFDNSKPTVVNSSSISTKDIDIYRQGVEMTQEKHNIGTVKISAGTAGHIIEPFCIGDEPFNLSQKNYHYDVSYFDPIKYLNAMEKQQDISKVFTFPIYLPSVSDPALNGLNGIIEPLAIRSVASFFSLYFPYEAHATRGTLMGGNSDVFYGASDRVLSIDYLPTKLNKKRIVTTGSFYYSDDNRSYINDDWFLEAFEYFNNGTGVPQQSVAYFESRINKIDSFDDTTVYLKKIGINSGSHGEDMCTAISKMKSPENNYVAYNKKSAPTGFTYDNVGIAGVDSIVFGGMTH